MEESKIRRRIADGEIELKKTQIQILILVESQPDAKLLA